MNSTELSAAPQSIQSALNTFVESATTASSPNVHITAFCNNQIWRLVNSRHKAFLDAIMDTMKSMAQKSLDARTLLIRVLIKLLIRAVQPHCVEASIDSAVILMQTLQHLLIFPAQLPLTLLRHITLPFLSSEMHETITCSPTIAYHRLYMTIACMRVIFGSFPALASSEELSNLWTHVATCDNKHTPPMCTDASTSRIPLIERVKNNITNAMYYSEGRRVTGVTRSFRLEGSTGVTLNSTEQVTSQPLAKHWLQTNHVLWCQSSSIMGSACVYFYQWVASDVGFASHLSQMLLASPSCMLTTASSCSRKRKRDTSVSPVLSRQILLCLIILYASSSIESYCDRVLELLEDGTTEALCNAVVMMTGLVAHYEVPLEMMHKAVTILSRIVTDNCLSECCMQIFATSFAYLLIHRYEAILTTPEMFNEVLLVYDTDSVATMSMYCDELCDVYVHVFILPLFNISSCRGSGRNKLHYIVEALDIVALCQRCPDAYEIISRSLVQWRSKSLPNFQKKLSSSRRAAYIAKLSEKLAIATVQDDSMPTASRYLSPELCMNILEYCNFRRVCRVACVSSTFAAASRHQVLWRQFFEKKWGIVFAKDVPLKNKQTKCYCFRSRSKKTPCSATFTEHNWRLLYQERAIAERSCKSIVSETFDPYICPILGCCAHIRNKRQQHIHAAAHIGNAVTLQ